MQNVQIISLDELRSELASGAVTQFWNVLTNDYFKGELIPGSRRVPLDQVGREVTRAQIAKDVAIVVYCAGPRCPQSGMAAEKLAVLGFSNVRSYEGGIEEWKGAGLAVVRMGFQATAA